MVSKEMGYKVSPPEQSINSLGYYEMNTGHLHESSRSFQNEY